LIFGTLSRGAAGFSRIARIRRGIHQLIRHDYVGLADLETAESRAIEAKGRAELEDRGSRELDPSIELFAPLKWDRYRDIANNRTSLRDADAFRRRALNSDRRDS
jgi:hypothetical protein